MNPLEDIFREIVNPKMWCEEILLINLQCLLRWYQEKAKLKYNVINEKTLYFGELRYFRTVS